MSRLNWSDFIPLSEIYKDQLRFEIAPKLQVYDNKNILVVDDDYDFTKLLEYTLSDLGDVFVDSANDYSSGVVKMFKRRIDAVIIDVQLPDSNGIELAQTILKIIKRDIPIIFVSSNLANKKKIQKENFNVHVDFMVKPINCLTLKKLIFKRLVAA